MNLSRRELLIGTIELGAILATGCKPQTENKAPSLRATPATEPAIRYNPRDFIHSQVAPFIQDINRDPLYRAASVTLFSPLGCGHGSLIERNGELFIYTVRHVLTTLSTNPTTKQNHPVFAHVPGVDFYNLNPQRFQFVTRDRDDDPPAQYQFSLQHKAELMSAMSSGVISPLHLISESPKVGENVAIARADTGKYTVYMANTIWTTGYDINLIHQNAGVICRGRSGGAVLKVANGKITPQVYGIIASAYTNDPQAECSANITMKIN